MKDLCIKLVGFMLITSLSLMASGPRVTGAFFAPIQNEIVAVEAPPFYSSNNPNGGMAFEIVAAALENQKETAALTTYPVQRMVNYYVTQEKVLAALGIHLNLSKAEKKNVLSIPIAIINDQYIYYKPAHPKGISWGGKLSELKGLTVGAHEGEDVKDYEKAKIKVVYGRSNFLFKKLKTGKVDFIKVHALSAKAIIDRYFASDKNKFGVMEYEPKKLVCKIYFNLNNTDAEKISKKFTKGLSAILNNGKYQEIIQKYEGKTALSSKNIAEFKTLWKKSF